MKKILILLLIIPFIFACSSDEEDEFIDTNYPIDINVTAEDIAGTFTFYKIETKQSNALEYASLITLEKEGYGIKQKSISPNTDKFTWILENGVISFIFGDSHNQKGYISKDKWGYLLIVEEIDAKRYYRNYDAASLITSLKLHKISNDIMINGSYKLELSYSPSDLSHVNFKWITSDNNLATVTNETLHTNKNSGRVKVYVIAGNIKDSIYVDIKEPKGYKFGYRFGASIAEIKPDIRVSSDFAYNYSENLESLKAFKFSNDKLSSIWSCYYNMVYFHHTLLREVNSLNPTERIFKTNENGNIIFELERDSISWEYQDFNILLRNGIMPEDAFPNNLRSAVIIEYNQL